MSAGDATTWTGVSGSVEQTIALGALVARYARAGDLIALIGELGAGKTQFVRGLASVLARDTAPIASPTFVMVHEYDPAPGRPALVHIDAYRLRSLADLESIGWELVGDPPGGEMRRDAVVVIEWADRLGQTLGADLLEVRLAHQSEVQRAVSMTGRGVWSERLADLRAGLARVLAAGAPHPCPVCRKPVAGDAPQFPFCNAQCQMIDLGRWLSDRYVISRPIEQSDPEEE